MKLKTEKILEIKQRLEEQGHPDPIGFIARSKLLSNLDHSFSNENKVGFTGVRQEDSQGLDVENFEDNLSAAVQTDINNFEKYGASIPMHSAFLEGESGISNKPQKFLKKLNKEKKKIDEELSSYQNKKQDKDFLKEDLVSFQEATDDEVLESSFTEQQDVPQDIKDEEVNQIQGNPNRLEEMRSSFKGLGIEGSRGIPKKVRSQEEIELKSYIRGLLKNA